MVRESGVPRPYNPTEVRSFLGLAGYYRRFIKNFSKIAGSLTNLTEKQGKYIWDTKCENSFQELKKQLAMALVLALPNGKVAIRFIPMLQEKG